MTRQQRLFRGLRHPLTIVAVTALILGLLASRITLNTALVVFKYVGLCLAAASSVWGTTHELTISSPNGKKRLTWPGVVSIVLTIVGLAVSIVFEDLQRRKAATDQRNEVAAEAERTNRIIVSAQPLTRLAFSLRFTSSDGELWQKMLEGEKKIGENYQTSQGGSLEVPEEVMEYQVSLIPLLKHLASLGADPTPDHTDAVNHNSDKKRGSIVAIVQLDDAQNTVLSFGEIDPAVEWGTSDGLAKLSAGFAPLDDYPHGTTRSGRRFPWVGVQPKDKSNVSYELTWDLDPVTLKNSINEVVEEIHPTAKLPHAIKMALLHNGTVLPFQKNDFALPLDEDFWSEGSVYKAEQPVPPMELTITVNGFDEIAYKYKLDYVYRVTLTDELGDFVDMDCTVLKFVTTESR
jgi:hypothetical protein